MNIICGIIGYALFYTVVTLFNRSGGERILFWDVTVGELRFCLFAIFLFIISSFFWFNLMIKAVEWGFGLAIIGICLDIVTRGVSWHGQDTRGVWGRWNPGKYFLKLFTLGILYSILMVTTIVSFYCIMKQLYLLIKIIF